MRPTKRAPRDMSITGRRAWFDELATQRQAWIDRNAYYYEDDRTYMRFLVPPGSRVVELGCGTGQLLAALEPSYGVGVDLSPAMIAQARQRHPDLEFRVGDVEQSSVLDELDGPFDYVVLSDLVGHLTDFQHTLECIHRLCRRDTRVVIASFSQLWRPALAVAELLGAKMPVPVQNWLSEADIDRLLDLSDFEPIKREWRLLLPKALAGLGPVVNRTLGTLPGVRRASLRHYVVARPLRNAPLGAPSATVVIPCRNEAGNIEPAVARIPQFCDDLEILFVEGHSHDGTTKEIERVMAAYPNRDIRLLHQDGRGKADAVHTGFDAASGDVLMILDADLTVPPEDLPKFYRAIASGKGEFVQGTRLVYPMAEDAMRSLNFAGNKAFARIFSWLLNQRITDTLCGTKVLTRANYRRLRAQRDYFGNFDPFGDFELIFGATRLSLRIVELPIRYGGRMYGATQISRFRDGVLLVRMVAVAFRKLKAP